MFISSARSKIIKICNIFVYRYLELGEHNLQYFYMLLCSNSCNIQSSKRNYVVDNFALSSNNHHILNNDYALVYIFKKP